MNTFFLLTVTGLGLGAMYFLIASGLSLIYGLMGVLNFAHGAFITVGAYGTWWTSIHVFDGVHSTLWRWLLTALSTDCAVCWAFPAAWTSPPTCATNAP